MAKRQRRRREERRRQQAKRQGWQTPHSVITGVGVVAGAVLGMSTSAEATDFTVNDLADPGDGTCDASCTLRDALVAARDNNNSPTVDQILFASSITGSPGTITLNGTQLPTIDEPLDIAGPVPGNKIAITVSGNNASRIFDVNPTSSGDPVGISGLALANGNAAGDGGAILNENAQLLVIHSVLSGNTASGKGGAISDYGGDPNAYSHIVYSTLSGNSASSGGAIYAHEAVTIGTSTLSGNMATSGPGGGLSAAGGGRPWVYNSTIAGNSATTSGGGVHSPAGVDFTFHSSIAADNTAGSSPDVDSSLASSFSLIENPGTAVVSPGTIVGQDPQLGPLASNGGITPTRKPAATSPVVDKGDSGLGHDQRLFARPVDNPNVGNAADGSDIGAVELSLAEGPQAPPSPPAPPTAVAPASTGQRAAALKKCKKKFPKGPRRTKCIKKAKRLPA